MSDQNDRTQPADPPPSADMVWIPGGTFQMGSEEHYPEERPVQRVSVDGFWIDRTPVTNESFARFVAETRHVTFAEMPPNPADYPGAKKELGIDAFRQQVQSARPELDSQRT